MTSWSVTRLVIAREVGVRVRTRSFALSTGFMILILAVVVLLPKLVGANSYTVAGVPDTASLVSVVQQAADKGNLDIVVMPVPTDERAERAVRDGDADVAVLDGGAVLVVERQVPTGLAPLLLAITRADLQTKALQKQGVSLSDLGSTEPTVRALDPRGDDGEKERAAAFVVMLILLSQISIFATSVAQGIVEEKSSRVIEVLVSTVRPTQILVGKIVGVGLANLLQLLLIGGVGLAAGAASGQLTRPLLGVVAQVVPWFLLSFALTASLYAAAGATVSRMEDLQSVLGPFALLIFANVILGQMALFDPDRPLVHVLSYVPPFSPVIMAQRWAGGDVGWVQLLSAMGVMLAAAVVVTWFGARVYRSKVLYFGTKQPLWKALRP